MNKLKDKHVALVSITPWFVVLQLGEQIKYFLSQGMDVTVITSAGEELHRLEQHERLHVIILNMYRKPKPWQDLKAIKSLWFLFRDEQFDIVHSFQPKAGLLCAIAGKLAGVRCRFHTFTGQAWLSQHGLMRLVMRSSDRWIVRLMTHCYADSATQREFLIAEHIASEHRLSVMGSGSVGGVNLNRFRPDRWGQQAKLDILDSLEVRRDSKIVTFIGRITKDKGVDELLLAFSRLPQSKQKVDLLLVGPMDGDQGYEERVREMKHVHWLGYQSEPEKFLAVSHVFCMPSYREGFGTVVIEAAAMSIPCVGTDIPGLRDAVENQQSGVLVPVKNVDALYKALENFITDDAMRIKMGEYARARAERLFSSELVSEHFIDEYHRWMAH
ncbi:MAG: glycosyltransferase family 1 protein [Zetaproteobacteria bacterium CG_4_9_14_3_um_filter_49_83]|nr:MAG: hypothetical protein AUJ56_01845 [Zetaproteobacteria bacterium CG1_02_49_23]PIQ34882.1 MAG: glycosyltransferase family 1 protein [Zetaproteobacteria bacterium CG17_big_fil_post_rev_8_21_14_2_50_50_13]PIV31201.1 MAG: glycosyltransferase family 1 protein [Zetaproteobacteria bacterium CG02_land_8_20_14_3_00_50_9]PIY55830.1 MAG: glycosyltransferase family 1 protein [Zetaproteobacteria bacterium CG_4_10_14_0_8_um_filter_49_80]PJA36183.1 MAG: glycosyltransferase family 1 protein [Zetaproteoba